MSDSNSISPSLLRSLAIAQKQSAEKPHNALGQSEFFELMITQLQNQDPLNPSDSNEFLAQIAQFSTVNGIYEMQKSMEQMAASFQSSQALQASTLVGREVLVTGSSARLDADGGIHGAVDLPAATGESMLNVYDAGGQVVRQLPLGGQAAGLVEFTWDGLKDNGERAPAGYYSVGASMNFEGDTYAAETLIRQRVDSVTLGTGGVGMQLNLAGGQTIGLNEIRQLL